MQFYIYADGSCKGNPGKGGFAYMIYDELGEIWYEGSGTHKKTTNNQMELFAVIEALRVLKKNQTNYQVKIYSDSAYVVNCFLENWIEKWEENGWKTQKKEDVANQDFWRVLNDLVIESGAVFERISRSDKKIKKVDEKAKTASKKTIE